MLLPFVVLVRPVGEIHLSLHAVAASDAISALAAVKQSLESQRKNDIIVGVFQEQDALILNGLFEKIKWNLK